MSNDVKPPTKRELIDAVNLLANFCDYLPDGWEIILRTTCDDAGIELINPDGDVVSDDFEENALNYRSLVNEAREREGMSII